MASKEVALVLKALGGTVRVSEEDAWQAYLSEPF